jgi:replicative DNA helicase
MLDDTTFVTDDLEELHAENIAKFGLRWRLKSLNKMLGSLRKGDFGFLFARPETGKTTFLASEVSYFASQLRDEDGPILWFNNEEDGKKVQIRIFQATLGFHLRDLFADLRKSNEIYREIVRGKIKIIDSATTSKSDVERICKAMCPSLILFDQIDKIRGFDGDREDLKLGSIYQWARELAKTYCPVIGVTQADGSAEGKKWLTMENVANAKTAKQAEADWILGIGATHQDGFEYIRHLHASKNKLTGDEDSDPNMRHGKVDCIIVPEIARYKDYE